MTAPPPGNEPEDVLAFWDEIGPKGWFEKNDDVDRAMRERFGELHDRALKGELDDWLAAARPALALVLLLDQFSRNLYRGDARAFAGDEAALEAARRALDEGFDREISMPQRIFFYMPLEHSESLPDQERCVALVHATGNMDYLHYAIVHRDVVRRFGRFPHRNSALGRHTTPAERLFLEAGGFGG